MGPLTRALRSLGNTFGIAWWARVETDSPEGVYWFGPFLTRKSLKGHLPVFMETLAREGCASVDHSVIRCRRGEPLTI